MTPFHALQGKARRRCLKLVRRIRARYLFVRGEASFRDVERLHQARLVTAAASKWNWAGIGTRPFKELAVFANEDEARKLYPESILPRRRGL
jgi:hypothetical protein